MPPLLLDLFGMLLIACISRNRTCDKKIPQLCVLMSLAMRCKHKFSIVIVLTLLSLELIDS
jgi:hypothetical protein